MSLISNPPYNLKWNPPPFAQLQKRFAAFEVPPASNANFAFVLTALHMIEDKAAFLLPNGVLTTANKQEAEIRKQLVEQNVIEAVITLPDSMFESTNIPTCILVLNRHKKTAQIVMVDMRQEYVEEQRDQRGQFGGASHEKRVYHKTMNVITDDGMNKALSTIESQSDIEGFSRAVGIEAIRAQDYLLTPSRYIEQPTQEVMHRPFADIAADYNRIVDAKNAVKLTVNESLAKSLGLYEVWQGLRDAPDLTDSFAVVGQKAEKENYLQLSKNAAEFRIENKDREHLPEMLMLFLNMWKQHIMYLNNEENRILAEFRDALLPELMSGKIEIR